MKNKGYTLMELLGVIIILALVITLIFPSIINFIKNSTDKTDEFNIELIENASDLYIDEYIDNFPKKNGNKFIIEIEDLIDLGYLPNSNDEDINNKCIQVTYSNEFKYELKDSGTCEEVRLMCEAVEEATTGNIPEGKYEAGDEYICEVKKGTNYRFFILSTEEDNVNLILDRNINSDGTLTTEALTKAKAKNGVYNLVAWVSKEDYSDDTDYGEIGNNNKGPITAMNFLYNATKDWTNIPNIQMNYEDEDKMYGTITTTNSVTKITKKDGSTVTVLTDKEGYTNLKARMPMYSELRGIGECGSGIRSCPLYLVNYLHSGDYVNGEGLQNISAISGYWILPSAENISGSAWAVDYGADVNLRDLGIDFGYGVRPVISVPKTSLY